MAIFTKNGFFQSFLDGLIAGEVFIYFASMSAPFFYLSVTKIKNSRANSSGMTYSLVLIFTIIFLLTSVIMFSAHKMSQIPEYTTVKSNVDSAWFSFFSFFVYIAGVLTWYYTIYVSNKEARGHDEVLEEKVSTMDNSLNKWADGEQQ
ncbi:hypothetical protein NEJAP_3551 [Neptunomonas japonica JAMM 1380]|uniref:Uncharacterized protein n=2 Tax=Neptunomonas TaxID=75687 RepID=A0A7R6PD17_9GAMM|nr:hypothetical protein NEJAP_3551 [Neptunomonas japonica JAMM 1380]